MASIISKSSTQTEKWALFDVDGTLLRGSTTLYAMSYLFRRRLLRLRYPMLACWYAPLHAFGFVEYEKLYEIGLNLMAGMDVKTAKKFSAECFEAHVKPNLYIEGIEEIRSQRRSGYNTAIVSAGPRYLIEEVGRFLGIDVCITAGPVIKDDKLTSKLDGALCSGEGKIERVIQYFHSYNIHPTTVCYYGDSFNDRYILDWADEAVAVNPDLRLKMLAKNKKWKIKYFSKTLKNIDYEYIKQEGLQSKESLGGKRPENIFS